MLVILSVSNKFTCLKPPHPLFFCRTGVGKERINLAEEKEKRKRKRKSSIWRQKSCRGTRARFTKCPRTDSTIYRNCRPWTSTLKPIMGSQNRAAEDEEYNHARQRRSENSELAVPLTTPLTPPPAYGPSLFGAAQRSQISEYDRWPSWAQDQKAHSELCHDLFAAPTKGGKPSGNFRRSSWTFDWSNAYEQLWSSVG